MVCNAQWNHEQWFKKNGHQRCPNCNTNVMPMNIVHNGFIEMNWAELVMLCTYAKRWTKVITPDSETSIHLLMAFDNIMKRLEKYRPDGMPALFPEKDDVEIKVEHQGVALKPNDKGKILSPFYQPKQGPLI